MNPADARIAALRAHLDNDPPQNANWGRQKPRKAPVRGRFSTDYAVEWGRAQGWRLLDRERYDFRTKRHHDLELGADARFDTPDGIVLVQGAGRGERAAHRRRFEERGGEAAAGRMKVAFVYLEFERDSKTPVREERW